MDRWRPSTVITYGLANLTIGAPGFGSNDCVSKNEVGFRDITVQGFNTQQNLRVPETHSSACLPMRVYGIEAAPRDDDTKRPTV